MRALALLLLDRAVGGGGVRSRARFVSALAVSASARRRRPRGHYEAARCAKCACALPPPCARQGAGDVGYLRPMTATFAQQRVQVMQSHWILADRRAWRERQEQGRAPEWTPSARSGSRGTTQPAAGAERSAWLRTWLAAGRPCIQRADAGAHARRPRASGTARPRARPAGAQPSRRRRKLPHCL